MGKSIFNERIGILIEDGLESDKLIKQNSKSQFNRRMHIKNYFIFMEGAIWSCKMLCLDKEKLSPQTFSQNEISILQEKEYNLNKFGEVIKTYKNLNFQSNLIFTLKMISKGFNQNLLPPKEYEFWKELNESKKIRNRITHPKNKRDFFISDNEFERFTNMSRLFIGIISDLMRII